MSSLLPPRVLVCAFYRRVCLPLLTYVLSVLAFIMVLLGGPGTLLCPAVGSASIVFLENAISAYTDRWLLILGLIYVVVTLFAPAGLLGLLRARQAEVRM